MEGSGISYKETISEFDKLFKKMKSTKERIESEIEKVNNSRDRLLDEITNSFEEQRIKLNEKEKALKSELDIKVTELKDQLEKFYIESNDILLSCERIYKAIQNYEKNNENNSKIKTLCYISKINKINIEVKDLLQKPFENTEISFKNDNTLDYKNYFINGIPKPKNIEIEQKDSKLYISWNIDNSYLDIENIQYLIILKNDKEESKYESSNTNLIIQEYKLDTHYEVKISTIVDDEINEDFYEIKRFKTYDPNTSLFGNINGLLKNNTKSDIGLFGNNNSFNISSDNNKSSGFFGNNQRIGFNLFSNINKSSGLFGKNNNSSGIFGNAKSDN